MNTKQQDACEKAFRKWHKKAFGATPPPLDLIIDQKKIYNLCHRELLSFTAGWKAALKELGER